MRGYIARQLLEQRRRALAAIGRDRAIIFGAGDGGERTIRAMLFDSDSPYVPVAFLDDDPRKRNLTIRGIRVLGDRGDLPGSPSSFGAKVLIMAVPTGDGALVRQLSREAEKAELDVRVVPSVRELLGGEVSVGDLREPTEADLLGRHKVETDLQSVSDYIRGRTVVVTGAGGSIGSELCRQLSAFSPGRLVMIDRDESGLHGVQLSLEGRALLDSDSLILIDIRDRTRVARLFAEIKPDVVFHAAALKHLPLLEAHPSEALKSNIWGTLSVLDAAAGAGVSHFVNISTDKAANAANVLGYSKRIAEGLTSSFGQRYTGRYLSVRFGNVLGSRGSVLTAFRAQLDRGGPLTVTHPEVTRYFMTIEEAVQLVIQAGAIGGDGHAMVLDMGEPVQIYDVARQLASARGDRHPDRVHRPSARREAPRGSVLLGGDPDPQRARTYPVRRGAAARPGSGARSRPDRHPRRGDRDPDYARRRHRRRPRRSRRRRWISMAEFTVDDHTPPTRGQPRRPLTDGPDSGSGQDLGTVSGHRNGVFEMGGSTAVDGDDRPTVVEHLGLGVLGGNHRLDGDDQAVLDPVPATTGGPKVRHLRRLVHRRTDPVADVLLHDREPAGDRDRPRPRRRHRPASGRSGPRRSRGPTTPVTSIKRVPRSSSTSPTGTVIAASACQPSMMAPQSSEMMSPSSSTVASSGMPWTTTEFGEVQITAGKPW